MEDIKRNSVMLKYCVRINAETKTGDKERNNENKEYWNIFTAT